LDHFPNLYIGVTGILPPLFLANYLTNFQKQKYKGVVTYTSNTNTSIVVREMVSADPDKPLRILLETDAPYMVPANLYESIPELRGKKLPVCHTVMVPWTAAFVADVAGERWDANKVMADARENARKMYGVYMRSSSHIYLGIYHTRNCDNGIVDAI
jgi:TatD DNase family protein